jgi:hypothetical protein
MADRAKAQIESWSIGRVKPYAFNAREHPKKQVEALKASLQRFGRQLFHVMPTADQDAPFIGQTPSFGEGGLGGRAPPG